MVESMSMGKIIRLNTNFKSCPDNVFFASRNCKGVDNHQCIPRSCMDGNCYMQQENMKLSDKVSDQEEVVTGLIVTAVILGILCLVLIIGAVFTRHRATTKTGHSGNCYISIDSV